MEDKLNNNLITWSGYLLLILSLASVSVTKYMPSLDGPQHLHTINVLTEIIKGNDFINQYYEINSTPVGYWSAHFIIGCFHMFLPSWLAEKAYMFVFIIGMYLSFRFLINQISPNKVNVATLLIFPFMYSTYQLLGYHTFCFAAIFYFVGYGVLLRFIENSTIKNLMLFSLITLAVFFSHALVFAFFVMSVGVIYIGIIIRQEQKLSTWLINVGKIFLAILPSFILWGNYIISVMHLDNTITSVSLTLIEQIKEFIRIRLLVGFSHNHESYGYRVLFILIAILSILSGMQILKSIKKWSLRVFFQTIFSNKNIFLIISLCFLGLYFFAPVKISAGNLTNRYGLYFFYNLIIWLSLRSFKLRMNIMTIVIIILAFVYIRLFHIKNYKTHQKIITELKEVEQHITPNSLVFHTIASKNWMDKHFPLYVGIDVPVVNIRNPQCWGHFPVVWNSKDMPNVMMGGVNKAPRIKHAGNENKLANNITYHIVYNQKKFWESEGSSERKKLLLTQYTRVFVSSNKTVELYKLKE